MVRAATTGAFDYSGADPSNKNWRIKHRLVLQEVHRRAEAELFTHVHRHWCAYLSHSNLKEESFELVKNKSSEALAGLQRHIFPWVKETPPEESAKPGVNSNSTIDPATQRLIDRYRELTAQRAQ